MSVSIGTIHDARAAQIPKLAWFITNPVREQEKLNVNSVDTLAPRAACSSRGARGLHLSPTWESRAAGEDGPFAQLLFDAQQLIIFSHPISAAKRTRLDLA